MTRIYKPGIDYFENDNHDLFKTYPIDEYGGDNDEDALHFSKIEVYGDEALRDKIIELLNGR